MALKGTSRTLSGKYRASICINGAAVHLGSFLTEDEAHAAYLEARAKFPKMSRKGISHGPYNRALLGGQQSGCKLTDATIQKLAAEADKAALARCVSPLEEREKLPPLVPEEILNVLVAKLPSATRGIACGKGRPLTS